MEIMAVNPNFWKDKSVFLSGHTGFKGSWMSLWLSSMGAKVTGYSLDPPTEPSLYKLANVESRMFKSIISDIRDLETLSFHLEETNPDIVIHMAAQPIVRDSYRNPVETYSINVMGTVNILESIRLYGKSVRVFLNVTTDKVYENKEWEWPYRETEQLGGFDPYSNSKGCSEMVTSSYLNSFFHVNNFEEHRLNIATARAGNVIGGGDFANDRLIPDLLRSILKKESLNIRNPEAVRPWQHVLEPISGYLRLVEVMFESKGKFNGPWNFGSNDTDAKPVIEIVHLLQNIIQKNAEQDPNSNLIPLNYKIDKSKQLHEANFLKLDISKVKSKLGWRPKWNLEMALQKIVEWMDAYLQKKDLQSICLKQIEEYSKTV